MSKAKEDAPDVKLAVRELKAMQNLYRSFKDVENVVNVALNAEAIRDDLKIQAEEAREELNKIRGEISASKQEFQTQHKSQVDTLAAQKQSVSRAKEKAEADIAEIESAAKADIALIQDTLGEENRKIREENTALTSKRDELSDDIERLTAELDALKAKFA